MIDHVSIAVRDLDASAAFYETTFAPLGLTRLVTRPAAIGFGRKYPEFWLNARPHMMQFSDETGSHVCLRAPSAETVKAFHDLATAAGGRCDGPPGDRDAAMTTYFGAFIRDPDGNKIEIAYFPQAAIDIT